MKNSKKFHFNKRWEFIKLCTSLTKQGFHFVKGENYTLVFDIIHLNWKFSILSAFTALPFVESTTILNSTHNKVTVYFNQWADKY